MCNWLVRLVVVAGLAVDAYVHADLASRYDPIGSSVSQGGLFRLEAGFAALAALLVLLVARRETYALALLIGASAFAAIVLYRYVDVGTLGPLPDMYEPVWFAEKLTAASAEAVALVGAAIGLIIVGRGTPRPGTAPSP